MSNRMLIGIFIAQYCVASLSTFFISWFPSYLVEQRHFTMLEAGFVAALPAICGCLGGISAGFFSDWLLRRSRSLVIARKVPITIGLCLSATIILCNYTAANSVVVIIMCAAFFGKGFGALGWTVIADTAPREAIGVTGGLFNAAGSIGGIITPIAIGAIVSTPDRTTVRYSMSEFTCLSRLRSTGSLSEKSSATSCKVDRCCGH